MSAVAMVQATYKAHAPAAAAPIALDPKAWATLQARAALCGVSLVLTTNDRERPVFVASKWAMTRQIESVAEVEAFLRRIGGERA